MILKDLTWLSSIIVYNNDNTSYVIIHLVEKVKRKSTNQLILEKLDKNDERLTKVESRLDNVESRLDNIENDVKVLKFEARKHGLNI